MSLIETGRRSLREREVIKTTCQQIFNTGLEILQARGIPQRDSLVFKYQTLSHTVNSSEPPVTVWLWAGGNLRKARSVHMQIQGIDKVMTVTRKKVKGNETFEGKTRQVGYRWSHDINLYEAQGYVGALGQLKVDLGL